MLSLVPIECSPCVICAGEKDIKAGHNWNPLLRLAIPVSRWCAVVVERALDKLFQFAGVGARAILTGKVLRTD